jgi:hypothetical protein
MQAASNLLQQSASPKACKRWHAGSARPLYARSVLFKASSVDCNAFEASRLPEADQYRCQLGTIPYDGLITAARQGGISTLAAIAACLMAAGTADAISSDQVRRHQRVMLSVVLPMADHRGQA